MKAAEVDIGSRDCGDSVDGSVKATCGARGYTLSRKRVSGLLFHGQIERHAARIVAMDGAIHFVSARLQVHLQRTTSALLQAWFECFLDPVPLNLKAVGF